MDITYLKSFYTTAGCNSISKAAKELHLTQPGLSIQLQSLESSLGKTLFNRSNKGVELTPEGQIVFKYAKAILALESNMYEDFKNLANQQKHLTLGACTSLADYALPCSAYTFQQIHPNIDIHIESTTSSEVLQKIKNQELNIGIIQSYEPLADIVEIPIIESQILLVQNSKMPQIPITFDDLGHIPFISRDDACFITRSVAKELETHGTHFKDLNIIFKLNSNEAIKSALLHQNAYAFIPEMVIKHELQNQTLKKVPLDGLSIACNYVLIYRKDYDLNPQEQSFINFITSSRRCFCY